MDGNDAALIETDGYGYVKTIDYLEEKHASDFRERLKACNNRQDRNTEDVKAVEEEFTRNQIPLIKKLIQNNNLSIEDIDIIGFHGQTIFHDPYNKVTIQLGNGELLALETGVPVIYDFRTVDVKNGGQGAPLIPIYHRALLQAEGVALPVAIINIGGVANLTWLDEGDNLIGFDTGPGNALIDDWMVEKAGQPFDQDGKLASAGQVNTDKLNEFLSLPYLSKNYPKSLDRNEFSNINLEDFSVQDGAATLMEMTVQSIYKGLQACPSMPRHVYVAGGGRHNKEMMFRLSSVLDCPVESVDKLGWNGDAVEAEGFAYMAVRTYLDEPITFPYTTGCSSPTVGGIIVGCDDCEESGDRAVG